MYVCVVCVGLCIMIIDFVKPVSISFRFHSSLAKSQPISRSVCSDPLIQNGNNLLLIYEIIYFNKHFVAFID